jgi:TM2 domain-containing membrane protein YozV
MSDTPVPPPPPTAPAPIPGQEPKQKLVAGLLGIFLGYLGIHRFYLGYTKIGIYQIIATVLTCGFAGLWGVIEGILYLVGGTTNGYKTDVNGVPLV